MQYKKKYISDKILEAGLVEYSSKGFRAGNISVIAKNAGVPIGNLYRYFDGKTGILDALVQIAYIQVPKLINQIYLVHTQSESPEKIDIITESLMEVFDTYGKAIVVMADKCISTRYEDFGEKLTSQVHNIVVNSVFDNASETDKIMAKLLSDALVNSLIDILRMDLEREKTQETVLRIIKFYFDRTERI